MPNRREYLVLSAIVGKAGLAGCLSNDAVPGGGSDDDDDDDDDSEQTESDDSDQQDADNEGEEGGEDDEDDEEDTRPRLASDLDEIFTEMRWFENEYSSSHSEYRNGIKTAVDELRNALDPIQNVDMVSVDEFDEISDVVLESTKNAVAAFEPQYDNVYNVAALSRNRLPDIRRYIEVRDWDAAEDELEDLIRILRSVSTGRYVDDNYPDMPIVNRLYYWLGEDVDYHEFRLIGDNVQHRGTGYDAPGFGRFVAGDLDTEIRYDPLDDTNPYNPLIEVQNNYDSFSVEDGREFSIYYRAHRNTDSDSTDPSESESISSVYIQCYESQDGVESAFDILSETAAVEDEFVTDGEMWHQVTVENGDSLYYAYVVLSGRYMITFGVSRDIWDKRGGDYHEVLRGTFLLPDAADEDLVEEGWPL